MQVIRRALFFYLGATVLGIALVWAFDLNPIAYLPSAAHAPSLLSQLILGIGAGALDADQHVADELEPDPPHVRPEILGAKVPGKPVCCRTLPGPFCVLENWIATYH